MSLVLVHVPGQPVIKTHPAGPNVISIDGRILPMQDFVDAVIREMTTGILERGDYRRELQDLISTAVEGPGWGNQDTRFHIAPPNLDNARQSVSIGGLDLLGHDFICMVVYALTNRNLMDEDDPRRQLVAACRKMTEVPRLNGVQLAIGE